MVGGVASNLLVIHHCRVLQWRSHGLAHLSPWQCPLHHIRVSPTLQSPSPNHPVLSSIPDPWEMESCECCTPGKLKWHTRMSGHSGCKTLLDTLDGIGAEEWCLKQNYRLNTYQLKTLGQVSSSECRSLSLLIGRRGMISLLYMHMRPALRLARQWKPSCACSGGNTDQADRGILLQKRPCKSLLQ